MTAANPIILVVDDCTQDALLMRMVFERSGLAQPLRFAPSGEEAIAYLGGFGAFRDRTQFPLPAVVLLDLNMRGKNGFEVLEWIREQAALRTLLVYILSASSRHEDIQHAYAAGATSYLVKPGNLDDLTHLARCLLAWLKLVHLVPIVAPTTTQGNGIHSTHGLDALLIPPLRPGDSSQGPRDHATDL